MRLDATYRIPQPFFTDKGLDELGAMADQRLANPEKYAHIPQQLGLDG
jgi:hypothetical protein